jgi:hypothetical protein
VAQRLRRRVAAVNASNKATEPYRGGADVAARCVRVGAGMSPGAHTPWYRR